MRLRSSAPCFLAASLTLLLGAAAPASGAIAGGSAVQTPVIAVWTGLGADPHWTTPANWVASVAPVAGNELVFPAGAQRRANLNDFPAGTSFSRLTVADEGYVLSGNSIQLVQGVSNGLVSPVENEPRLDLPIRFPGDALLLDAGGGIRFTGPLELDGALTIDAQASSVLTFEGVISGDGGIGKSTPGILSLTGTNTYGGFTSIAHGLVVITNPNAFGSTTSGTSIGASAELYLGASMQVPESILVAGGTITSWGNVTLLGELSAFGEIHIFAGDDTTLTVAGAIAGPWGLTKTGGGTLQFTAIAKTYTGATSVDEGELRVVGPSSLQASAVDVAAGATFSLASGAAAGPIAATGGRVCVGCGGYGLTAAAGLDLDALSSLAVFFDGIDPGLYSRLDVSTGTVAIDGASLEVDLGFEPPDNWIFEILDVGAEGSAFELDDLPEGGEIDLPLGRLEISYLGGDGNDVTLTWRTDRLLADGFESHDLSAWSSHVP